MRYVSGEHDAIAIPHGPIFSMGTKIPLINTKGNFTKVVSIIIFDGKSLGGEESTNPKDEKQNEARTILSGSIRGSVT